MRPGHPQDIFQLPRLPWQYYQSHRAILTLYTLPSPSQDRSSVPKVHECFRSWQAIPSRYTFRTRRDFSNKSSIYYQIIRALISKRSPVILLILADMKSPRVYGGRARFSSCGRTVIPTSKMKYARGTRRYRDNVRNLQPPTCRYKI